MATITHTFIPTQVVYELTSDCGVVEVTVLSVSGIVNTTGTTVTYTVQETKSNKSRSGVDEANLYALLDGVGSALEAYALTIV